jgi:hypothetical protein
MNEHRTFVVPGAGLKCSNCGEILDSVKHSRQTDGLIIRRRYCKCGHVNETVERVIGSHQLRSRMSNPHE